MAYIEVEITVPVKVAIHTRPLPQPGEFVREWHSVASQAGAEQKYDYRWITVDGVEYHIDMNHETHLNRFRRMLLTKAIEQLENE